MDVLRTFSLDFDPSKLACDRDLVNNALNLKGGCNGTPQEVTTAVRRTERLQLRCCPLLHPRSNHFKIQILVQNGKPRNAALELRIRRAEQPPKVPEASDRRTRMKVDRRLTEHNPNVFYELAIRHAKRKAVVLLIQKGQRIPFDVAPNRVIHYDTADWNSPGQCVNELKQQIEAVLKDPLAAYNPISAAIDFLALRGSSDPFKQIVAEL